MSQKSAFPFCLFEIPAGLRKYEAYLYCMIMFLVIDLSVYSQPGRLKYPDIEYKPKIGCEEGRTT